MSEHHQGPLEEIEEALVEFERRVIRLGRLKVPLPSKRFVLIAMLIASLLFVSAVLAVTRSPLAKSLILPAVGRVIAADVRAESLVVEPNGSIVLRGVEARVPGMSSDAGRFFAVDRAKVDLRWLGLLRGEVDVRSVVLDEPVVRVSQSIDTGRLNVAGLSILSAGAGTPSADLPELIANGAVIEIAEHTTSTLRVLKQLRVEGAVRAADSNSGGYFIELVEADAGDGRSPLAVTGFFGPGGLTLELDRVALADWGPEVVPAPVRPLWDRMGLAGTVRETRFTYGLDGTVLAEMFVDGVELSLPIGESGPAGEPNWARMTEVSGVMRLFSDRVQADLEGLFADLPYDVAIAWDGTSLDAPFEARLESRSFELAAQPEFLPFAPGVVRRRLASFDNPTGLVDASVRISRRVGDDGVIGPVRYDGVINFHDVTAAYEHFPYRFSNLAGTARFNNDELVIDRIEGTAPSGASILATGRIWPPRSGAQVDLDIRATGVPLDDAINDALGEGRRKIIATLFNEQRYRELRELGLILTPQRQRTLRERREAIAERVERAIRQGDASEALERRLAEIDAALEAPAFALGGAADVQVRILREPGDDSEWERIITVRLPEAGLLPEQFPLPIEAEDVVIVIENDQARLAGGVYRALGGGEATVEADVFLGDADDDVLPDLRIEAWDVAVDERLLHAIPDIGEDGSGDARSAGELLAALGVRGTVACTALIAPRPGTEKLGYDISVTAQGLRAEPASSAGAVSFEDLTGTVEVSERRVAIDLDAEVIHAGVLPDPVAGLPSAGRLSIEGSLDMMPAGDPLIWARIRGERVDLASQLEDAIAGFSTTSAAMLRDARTRWQPSGIVDVDALVRGPLGDELDSRVTLTNIQRLAFTAMGGRIELGESAGSVTARAGEGGSISLESFETELTYEGEPSGSVIASGTLPLGPVDSYDDSAADARLELELEGLRLEGGLASWFASERRGDAVGAWWQKHDPAGVIDASLGVWPRLDEVTDRAQPAPLALDGVIRPKRFDLTARNERVRFSRVDGLIEFDSTGGVFTDVRADAGTWSIAGDGEWSTPEPGATIVRATADLEAQGMPAGLRAMLPAAVAEVVDGIEFDAAGPLRGLSIELAASRAAGEDRWAFDTSGDVGFQDASLKAGVQVRDADGSMEFAASRPRPELPAEFDLRVLAERALVSGVEATSARVRVMSGEAEREIFVPLISADCHGGRVAGEAVLTPAGDDSESPLRYAATLTASGVRLAAVLRDIARSLELDSTGLARTNGEFDTPDVDTSRGEIDAEFGISGTVDQPETRRGRGSLRVAGGEVVDIPGILPLIEVSNFQLPASEQLDFARATFYLDDERVSFEDVSVYSSSIEILGFGTMTWPERILDLRFNSRAARRIPVVSDVLEGIRDELISTQVVGPLGDYEVKVVQLSGTRAVLGKVFGAEESDQDQRLRELKRRAEQERTRLARPSATAPAGR